MPGEPNGTVLYMSHTHIARKDHKGNFISAQSMKQTEDSALENGGI